MLGGWCQNAGVGKMVVRFRCWEDGVRFRCLEDGVRMLVLGRWC